MVVHSWQLAFRHSIEVGWEASGTAECLDRVTAV